MCSNTSGNLTMPMHSFDESRYKGYSFMRNLRMLLVSCFVLGVGSVPASLAEQVEIMAKNLEWDDQFEGSSS